jgi:hypothetical protein
MEGHGLGVLTHNNISNIIISGLQGEQAQAVDFCNYLYAVTYSPPLSGLRK